MTIPSKDRGILLKQDINDICVAGDIVGQHDSIFQQVSVTGEPQNSYIALEPGQVIPVTTTPQGYWRKRTFYDLQTDIS
jgi:hypothetical protein